jgi:hypothetical protein
MIKETPVVGNIYKLKHDSCTIWLFKSAYRGKFLTEHEGACCINDGGDSYFTNYISRVTGCHIGTNSEIVKLVPANENEIAIFNRRLGL